MAIESMEKYQLRVKLKRNYKTVLTDPVPADSTWEIEFRLWVDPASELWYLLIDPWTANEENVFYHRASGTSVFAWWENREDPKAHTAWTQVRLSNSIDYMNFLLANSFNQWFVYRKWSSNVVIMWGNFFVWSNNVFVEDVDTSLWVQWKTLIPAVTNYVYLRTPENETPFISIETAYDPTAYVLAKIMMAWSVVEKIIPYRSLGVWTQWPVGLPWEQGVPWPAWVSGSSAKIDSISVSAVNPWMPASGTSTLVPWTENHYVMSFAIPRWEKGDEGIWINWRGIYSLANTYEINDAVSYNWSSYVARVRVLPWAVLPWSDWNVWWWLAMKGDKWDITAAPPWTEQTVSDNTVLPQWASGTTDWSTFVRITYADGSYDQYALSWIYKYYSDGTLAASTETVWVWSSGGINYADDGIFINATTFAVSYSGKPAYKNIQNVFEKTNTFNEDVIFKKRVSYPFNDLWLKTWNFNFNGNAWVNQKVTIDWWSNHVCYLWNMTPWVYVLYVYQNSTSGWIVFQNVAGWGWFTQNPHIVANSFVNDWTAAATAWAHIFTVMSSWIAAHVTYVGKSVSI